MATPDTLSLFKAFKILEAFNGSDEWLTSCELSSRANMPKASGYRLIQTLEKIGAVMRGPRGRYRPGMLLVSLAGNVAIEELIREASQPVIIDMANRLNVSVRVGILEGGMLNTVAIAATPTSASGGRVGTQHEAYCSARGKVLLAALPDDQLESFMMDGELVAITPNTIVDSTTLRRQLAKVREQGFALDDCEFRPDIKCAAVPIRDGKGQTVAALAAVEHADCMTRERQAEILHALFATSAALSRKIYPTAPVLECDEKVIATPPRRAERRRARGPARIGHASA